MRTALTLTVVGFITSFPLIGLLYVFSLFRHRPGPLPWVVWVTVPITTAVVTFLVALVGCFVFNAVARLTGGIPYSSHEPDA
jgi:hypothetical protein